MDLFGNFEPPEFSSGIVSSEVLMNTEHNLFLLTSLCSGEAPGFKLFCPFEV